MLTGDEAENGEALHVEAVDFLGGGVDCTAGPIADPFYLYPVSHRHVFNVIHNSLTDAMCTCAKKTIAGSIHSGNG